LLEHFGSAVAALAAGPAGWQDPAVRLRPDALSSLQDPPWHAVDADLEWQQQDDNHIITLSDDAYPSLLRGIDTAPPVLYVHGILACLAMPQLAMVGSRNPSPDGDDNAYYFARSLASSGLVVTSGLAIGIDTAAHRGALSADGFTIAVAGTGLDRVYPASNRDLAHQIASSGALVSEFPLGSGVRRGNFPRRNRVLSGLSIGTVVVEATLRSGSLITARLAMEQGREVFAIPGSIHNPLARGCHRLLRDGAKLVETAADVLEELGPLANVVLSADNDAPEAEMVLPDDDDGDYRTLLDAMGFAAVAVDSLVERSGLTAETVSSMLLILELNGNISAMPGGLYLRTGKRS